MLRSTLALASYKLSPTRSCGTLVLLGIGLLLALPAEATWSVVATDSVTQEVAIGSATCVTGFDLRAATPAIVVGVGGGAVQSLVDSSGQRRQTIRSGLVGGLTSQQIIDNLTALSGSASHQNGVSDTAGGAATFSGASTFDFSSGLTGSFGTVSYAIQGNILTGQPVLGMAETALRDTVGDLPAKLMAAMQAARAMGGDGRCSCPGSITGCGSPPPTFTKSAHIGYLLVARYGDPESSTCGVGGCAEGDYYLDLNVAFQQSGDPEPVEQLQGQFDTWAAGRVGRPDGVASTVSYQPTGQTVLMTVALADRSGTALTSGGAAVTIAHAAGSAGSSTIGPVTDLGDGTYQAVLTPIGDGVDLFEVAIDDGVRPVVLPPRKAPLDLSGIFSDDFETGDTDGWSAR